jgi:hypothetical protein
MPRLLSAGLGGKTEAQRINRKKLSQTERIRAIQTSGSITRFVRPQEQLIL